MAGKVYHHRTGYRVYFKGDWFYHDEYGRPFKAEFYAYAFLDMLNALYDPDPARNRYDPKRFKSREPYEFDRAFELYLERKGNDSGWHDAKGWTAKKYFSPFFANQDFRTIDKVQLERFQGYLEKKKLRGKTIKNIMGILHGFLNYFRDSIVRFPVFPDFSYQQPKIKWFTDAQIDQVFEFIRSEDKGYFLFLRLYGVRPEEASGLLRNAINWETREVSISTVFVNGQVKPRTKTNTERVLPIIPEIEQYLKPVGLSTFVFSINGKPYTRHMRENRWRKAMAQAAKKYGTRGMTLRDLRHSAATKWRRAGTSLDIISKILGHSDLRTTDRFYADIISQDLVQHLCRGSGKS